MSCSDAVRGDDATSMWFEVCDALVSLSGFLLVFVSQIQTLHSTNFSIGDCLVNPCQTVPSFCNNRPTVFPAHGDFPDFSILLLLRITICWIAHLWPNLFYGCPTVKNMNKNITEEKQSKISCYTVNMWVVDRFCTHQLFSVLLTENQYTVLKLLSWSVQIYLGVIALCRVSTFASAVKYVKDF